MSVQDPEEDAQRCPRCGFYDGRNYPAVRHVPGLADFGWRCPSCEHQWGFEVLTFDPDLYRRELLQNEAALARGVDGLENVVRDRSITAVNRRKAREALMVTRRSLQFCRALLGMLGGDVSAGESGGAAPA